MNKIRFYGHKQPCFEFSNFYRAELFIDGKTWPTSEHYYQAMKFIDPELQEMIRTAKTPAKAAALGRDKKYPLRPDWDDVDKPFKIEAMWTAIHAKFTQHTKLRDVLVGTEDAVLVEASPTDYYWGDGKLGTGQNMLGRLLEILRDELK